MHFFDRSNSGPKALRNTVSVDLGYKQQPALPPISFSDVLVGKDPNWIRYDVRRGPDAAAGALSNLVFAMLRNGPQLPSASDAEKRVTQQWISPRHPRQNWTNETMGILFDMSSPVVENWFPDTLHGVHRMAMRAVQNEQEGKSSWDHPPWGVPRLYPTVNMNIEMKRMLPPEVRISCSAQTNTLLC